MKKYLMLILALWITFPYAGTLKDINESDKLVKSIMEHVLHGEIEKGLDLMQPFLIVPKSEFETMKSQFSLQAPLYEKRFGKILGVEFLKKEELGKSLYKVVYIQKFEKHLMSWNFYFYKPNKEWVLNTFRTYDNIEMLFH